MKRPWLSIAGALLGALLVGGVARADTHDDDQGFEEAYQSVRSGARETARSGGYYIAKARDGAIKFMVEARNNSPEARAKVGDAVLVTKIKAKLASDKDVIATGVNVDSSRGMITLRGTVRSQHEAARAVSHALTTDGVIGVTSMLTWPGMNEAKAPVTLPKTM